jgi:hypothetical protein
MWLTEAAQRVARAAQAAPSPHPNTPTPPLSPPLSPPPSCAAAGPGPEALRLHVHAEIMAAAGFTRDRLYVEYSVAFDPGLWALQGPAGAALEEPGLLKVRGGGAVAVARTGGGRCARLRPERVRLRLRLRSAGWSLLGGLPAWQLPVELSLGAAWGGAWLGSVPRLM